MNALLVRDLLQELLQEIAGESLVLRGASGSQGCDPGEVAGFVAFEAVACVGFE